MSNIEKVTIILNDIRESFYFSEGALISKIEAMLLSNFRKLLETESYKPISKSKQGGTMFISFKDIQDEDEIQKHLESQLGKYVALMGHAPKCVEISIEDFERLKFEIIDPRTVNQPSGVEDSGYHLKGSGIPIKIH